MPIWFATLQMNQVSSCLSIRMTNICKLLFVCLYALLTWTLTFPLEVVVYYGNLQITDTHLIHFGQIILKDQRKTMSEKNTISKLHTEIQCVKAVSVFQLQTINKRLRSLLFRNVKQCRLVVSYWFCGTTNWSHLQGSSSPRRMSKTSLTNYQP